MERFPNLYGVLSQRRHRPAFRDGAIAQAVDTAVNAGSLYFSSGGNDGLGWRFDPVRHSHPISMHLSMYTGCH